jgi:hypothetical protein
MSQSRLRVTLCFRRLPPCTVRVWGRDETAQGEDVRGGQGLCGSERAGRHPEVAGRRVRRVDRDRRRRARDRGAGLRVSRFSQSSLRERLALNLK